MAKFLLNPVTGKLDLTDDAKAIIDSELADLELSAEKVLLTSSNENLLDVSNVKAAVEKIAAKVWYSKITIQGLAVTAGGKDGVYEVGFSVPAPTLTWKTSKRPVKTVCDDMTLAATDTSYTVKGNITTDRSVKVSVTEVEGGTATASLFWKFAYAVYSGMATVPASFTQEWVKTTVGGKTLKKSASGDYTMKGSTTEYWWLIAPTSFAVDFTTKLGDGGAEKVGEVADFVSDTGKSVPMAVYRASKIQRDDMKISVK